MRKFQLNYQPREYFKPFHSRDKRFTFLCAHRRCGKSYAAAADLVIRALNTRKTRAQFVFAAPTAAQARSIIWKALNEIIGDLITECKTNQQRLSITFPNGAEIRVVGLTDADSLRGLYFDGIIIDECQDVSYELLSTVILPALSDRKGFLVISGTPKGTKNSFYRQFKKAEQNPNVWHLEFLPFDKTNILPESEIKMLMEEMSEEDFNQEYRLYFHTGNRGSILGKNVEEAENDGRIVDFEHVKSAPFKLVFDVGLDTTACIFVQVVNGRVDIVDYLDWQNVDIKTIISEIQAHAQQNKYKLEEVHLPHDCFSRNIQTGKDIAFIFREAGFYVKQSPDLPIRAGIDASKNMLTICNIHKSNCYQLIESLKSYTYEWDKRNEIFKSTPSHNWASHGADAFRYMSLVISHYEIRKSRPTELQVKTNAFPQSALEAKERGYSQQEINFLFGYHSSGSSSTSWFK